MYVNPSYTAVRLNNGDETTVSLKQVALRGGNSSVFSKNNNIQPVSGIVDPGDYIYKGSKTSNEGTLMDGINSSPLGHDHLAVHPHSSKRTNTDTSSRNIDPSQPNEQTHDSDCPSLRRSSRNSYLPKYREDYQGRMNEKPRARLHQRSCNNLGFLDNGREFIHNKELDPEPRYFF
ncbi:hypothetical protein J6590_005285 [Homalodisca vitripennis]|nr:hypothetical protein J6590_005285 [Homalodisca vitripennis]